MSFYRFSARFLTLPPPIHKEKFCGGLTLPPFSLKIKNTPVGNAAVYRNFWGTRVPILSHILYNFGGTHLPKIPPVFKDTRGARVPTLPHYLKILEVPTSRQVFSDFEAPSCRQCHVGAAKILKMGRSCWLVGSPKNPKIRRYFRQVGVIKICISSSIVGWGVPLKYIKLAVSTAVDCR